MRYLRDWWGGNDKKLCLVINVLPLVCENQQTNEIFSGTLLVSYGAWHSDAFNSHLLLRRRSKVRS